MKIVEASYYGQSTNLTGSDLRVLINYFEQVGVIRQVTSPKERSLAHMQL
jgi:hypothetical protein